MVYYIEQQQIFSSTLSDRFLRMSKETDLGREFCVVVPVRPYSIFGQYFFREKDLIFPCLHFKSTHLNCQITLFRRVVSTANVFSCVFINLLSRVTYIPLLFLRMRSITVQPEILARN